MTRREVASFVWHYWWQLGVVAVLVVGWVVRVEASVGKMAELQTAAALMESLGRLECLRDRQRATLAGVPCGTLLREWGLQ